LEIFDKKYKLAHNDAADLRGALKRLEERNFDEELVEARQLLFENEAKSLGHKNACKNIKRKITKAQKLVTNLQESIDAVPGEPINIKNVERLREELINSLKKYEQKNTTNQKNIEKNNIFIEKAKSFLRDFDIEKLEEKQQIEKSKKQELDQINKSLTEESRTHELYCNRAKTLEGVPCGNQFVTTCKFIKDAYSASKLIDSVADNIAELEGNTKKIEQEVVELDMDSVRTYIKKHKELLDKKTKVENDNVKLRLGIERSNNQILQDTSSLENCQEKIDYYYENKTAIENYNVLLNQKEDALISIRELECSLEECENEVLELYKIHGSYEQNIINLEQLKEELQQHRQSYEAYDLYLKCMNSNGIAYDIIKKRLPVINNEIAKVLTNIVNFDVFLENDGRKLDIYIKHPRFEPRPLELGSGAEKTISAMAIRLALLSVSSLPKGNVFILDEPGTALDEDNMEGFVRILDMVKDYYKTVLLISHLDSLKDCVDTQIVIDKKDGFAFINQ